MPHFEKLLGEAKRAGYRDSFETSGSSTTKHYSEIMLDPKFWQFSGKARGWDEVNGQKWESAKFGFMPVWKHHWHCFIDHLASGSDAESFFASIATRI